MPLYIISFILFDLLPLPVLAIPPFCAFGLLFITISIKFPLISLEPDWFSFHVFNCTFMLIPWNISAFCSLDPFFLHSFDLNIFPSQVIYHLWAFFPFIPDILVISSYISLCLPSRIFHLSIHCSFPTPHLIPCLSLSAEYPSLGKKFWGLKISAYTMCRVVSIRY